MNILFDIALKDGTSFHLSRDKIEVGGTAYDNKIETISSWTKTLSSGRFFQPSTLTIKIADPKKIIKAHFEDDLDAQRNLNSPGTLKKTDGTPLLQLKLTKTVTEQNYIIFYLDQNTDIIKNNLLQTINLQKYPGAVSAACGQPIPFMVGKIEGGGTAGSYSAWKVNLDIGGGIILHYLLGDCHLTSVDRVMHNGSNISTGWSLYNHTDGRAYLIYAAGTADTVEVNVTRSATDLTDFVEKWFDLFGSYAFEPDSDFIDRLNRILYIPTMNYISGILDKQLQGSDFMHYFCQWVVGDWHIDAQGKISVSCLEMESQVGKESASFIESDTDGNFKSDQKSVINKISFKHKYVPLNGNYKWPFIFNKTESQENAGIADGELENRFTDYDQVAFGSAKMYANLTQYPRRIGKGIVFTGLVIINKFLDLELGDIIKLTHSKAASPEARYYRIESMSFDLKKNTVTCDLWDLTWMSNIANISLLIQSGYPLNENNSSFLYDYSPKFTHGFLKYGSILHSSAQSIFKNTSLFFEDIQAIKAIAKSPNVFKLLGDSYDYIFCSRIRPNTAIENSVLFTLYHDANNYLALRILSSNVVPNYGFETVGSGGADVFADWTEYKSGTSTITRDTSVYYAGDASCRIDLDGSGSRAYVSNAIVMDAGGAYSISIRHKQQGSLTKSKLWIYNSGSNVWLKSDGTWQTSSTYIDLPPALSWAEFALNITAHASYSNYVILLEPGLWASSGNSCWYDNVKISGPGKILNLQVVNSGVSQVDEESDNDMFVDTGWYFVALAKIGTEWGVYVCKQGDGTVKQVAYASYAAGDFLSDPYILIGRTVTGNYYLGYGDEFAVVRGNALGFAPASDLSDTIDEPLYPLTDRFLRGY